MKKLSIFLFFISCAFIVSAQNDKKFWEFGAGVTSYGFNRLSIRQVADNALDAKVKTFSHGGNLYVARELNEHFYLDFQGTIGASEDIYKNKSKMFYNLGAGAQWRLGKYFKSTTIDPYLRGGVSYMYKGFGTFYSGSSKDLQWSYTNKNNKSGSDKKHLVPLSVGLGSMMWLTPNFGFGVEGGYMVMPYKNIANSYYGTLRLTARIGRKPKPTPCQPEYIIEEKIKIVRDTIETIVYVPETKELGYLVSNINFDFDEDLLKPEYQETIQAITDLMLQDTSRHYLITGCTDTRGSLEYNQKLSERRARQIVDALVRNGVPATMLKYKGVSKKIAHAPYGTPHYTREGDRKVLIEVISNMDYWKSL